MLQCKDLFFIYHPMHLSSSPNENNHLNWAKERALELANAGQLKEAIKGMVADLSKDPDQKYDAGLVLAMAQDLLDDSKINKQAVIDWINGWRE